MRASRGAVEIARIEHGDPAAAEELCRLLVRSYSVEAELIGAVDFPPLRRSAVDVRNAESTFYGAVDGGRLIAAAELEQGEGGSAHIASFVVDPDVFRLGIGSRLLEGVLALPGIGRVTVSTAALNQPAVALYQKRGFTVSKRWAIAGIDMVTMAWNAPICRRIT
jgi:ribosomal protein S18 acetylase RimI-like enzyme